MNKTYAIAIGLLVCVIPSAQAQDLNEAYEKAFKDSIAKAAPYIVKIETAGGSDVLKGGGPKGPNIRKGVGPTTGVIVGKDGYIISSAFNFANKPTDIFVTVPGKDRKVAKIIANDTNRMLTLLKVDYNDLTVPEAYSNKSVRVGQSTLALGRALDPEISRSPSVSVGIVSAIGRIWGKAIQTDCKVSPANYGGPLVSIDGKIMGILVPASPQGEGDTAGVEWYDSGIGFAIPFEDVLRIFPRLKDGKDIGRGRLGFMAQNPTEMYNVPVIVDSVMPKSSAEKIGLKKGDKVISLDGKPVASFSELMHLLGPKYEGEFVDLVVMRDGKETEFKKVELTGSTQSISLSFLGILPMRDDPEAGVEVRYVYPKSAADVSGIKAGDRIMKIAPAAAPALTAITGGKTQLTTLVRGFASGVDVKVELKRKEGDKTETVNLKLGSLEDQMPDALPQPSSKEKALDKPVVPKKVDPKDPKKVDPKEPKKEEPKKEEPKAEEDDEKKLPIGYQKDLADPVSGRKYWMYVPDNYKKDKSYGVIIWYHNTGKGGKDGKDLKDIWERFCDSANYILIGPQSKTGNDWVPTEFDDTIQTVMKAVAPYTIDKSRVITHGMGLGGSMALYTAFHARETIRGCCVSGAVLTSNAKDNVANQSLSFFMVAGDKDPNLKEIQDSVGKLKEKKYPTIYRELKEFGKEYLDQTTLTEICAWLDSLDRI